MTQITQINLIYLYLTDFYASRAMRIYLFAALKKLLALSIIKVNFVLLRLIVILPQMTQIFTNYSFVVVGLVGLVGRGRILITPNYSFYSF